MKNSIFHIRKLLDTVYITNEDETELLRVSESSSTYVIPASIERIANGTSDNFAFKAANSAKFSVSFAKESAIQEIGEYAFYQCNNLLSIDFTKANKLRIIYYCAFARCYSLTSIEFPASLEELAFYGAFYQCSNLAEVRFKKESLLRVIDGGSFLGTAITTIEIPKSCSYISHSAFAYAPLKEFLIEQGNTKYNVYNGSLYSYNFNTLICHQKITPLLLHQSTTCIGSQSLAGFRFDTIIPANITSFDGWTFLGFAGKLLTIMADIDTINERMFECSGSLQEIRFLGRVNHIAPNAFSTGSGIKTIYFLYPVQTVSIDSFSFDISMICFAWNVQNLKKMLQPKELLTCNMAHKIPCTQRQIHYIQLYPKIFVSIVLFMK